MIVLSAFALLLALVAVTYFAGRSSTNSNPPAPLDPNDPLNPANPLGMLNPASPLSPLWTPPADTPSNEHPRHHPGESHPITHDPSPLTPGGDTAPHASSLSPDPGSFDAGSHSHH